MDGEGCILLTWIGATPMDQSMLGRVQRGLEAAFGLPTALRSVNGPPEDTLDLRRGQRSSTKILRWLLGRLPPEAVKVVGITDADLYIPVLTFVFGEAQVGGPAAVVSTARLTRTYDGREAAPGLAVARLIKECVHEIGHTFGLVHCPDGSCVMSRSNSLVDVDRKQARFCRACRQRLWELMGQGGEP
jgi:archaemetzincin